MLIFEKIHALVFTTPTSEVKDHTTSTVRWGRLLRPHLGQAQPVHGQSEPYLARPMAVQREHASGAGESRAFR
jgi:hypothetical protein